MTFTYNGSSGSITGDWVAPPPRNIQAVHEGVELPLIAKLTGLTKKEVEKLAKEMNN